MVLRLLLSFQTLLLLLAIAFAEKQPDSLRTFVRHLAPDIKATYGGSVVIGKMAYYLFFLTDEALAGLLVINETPNEPLKMVYADTALSPSEAVPPPLLDALNALLLRAPRFSSYPSQIGQRIDEIISPLTGIRLGTNATGVLLRLLQTGPALSVDPERAPPGSIIVSPTSFSHTGEVALGHAGILGGDGQIYSADARLQGAWAKNFTLKKWQKQFSARNGTYAFVLQAKESGSTVSP